MNFDQAFDRLMGVEKGYWDDPVGGPTNWGITERVARAAGYTGLMRDLPLALAKQIAKREYWDKYQCDQFDPAIGYQIFDTAYNGGHPVQWLQQAVGVKADGIVGAITIGAVRNANPAQVILAFNAYRLKYMAGLKNRAENSGGWMTRVADCMLIQTSP